MTPFHRQHLYFAALADKFKRFVSLADSFFRKFPQVKLVSALPSRVSLESSRQYERHELTGRVLSI
jgi:hypothetical protein